MTDRERLTPRDWIAIAMIAVGVLGAVIAVSLGEHNARLENVETTMRAIAEAQGRMAEAQGRMAEALTRTEGDAKATQERLAGFEEQVNKRFDRIEASLDSLIQLHLNTNTQPADARAGTPANPE